MQSSPLMADLQIRNALRTIAAPSLFAAREFVGAGEDSWEQGLLAGVSRERITGLAVAAVDAGALELSSRGYDDLLTRHEHQLALDARLEQLLIVAARALNSHCIEFRALK